MKTQFEYDIVNLYPAVRDNVEDREQLDSMGKDGWELIAIHNVDGQLQAYLKRKIKVPTTRIK